MIGCSFVVDREYFGQIGLLDPGMEVYGGENIELGMRVRREANTSDYPPPTSLFREILFMLLCAHYYSFYLIKKHFKTHECNVLQFV